MMRRLTLLILAVFMCAGCSRSTVTVVRPEVEPGDDDVTIASGDLAPTTPDALVIEVLQKAEVRAMNEKDPRDSLSKICHIAMGAGAKDGLEFVRRAEKHLSVKDWPARSSDGFSALAVLAAPHEMPLRDRLLVLAKKEAELALATEALWKAAPLPEGMISREGDPQKALDWQRARLTSQIQLWEAILKSGTDRPAAVQKLRKLLTSNEVTAIMPGCTQIPIQTQLMEHLADLDPSILVAAWPRSKRDDLANFCYQHAYQRDLSGLRDRFTQQLVRLGKPHGPDAETRQLDLLQHYDPEAAVKEARRSEGHRLVSPLIHTLALKDTNRALALVQEETDDALRGICRVSVAKAQARNDPDHIERILESLPKEYHDELRGRAAITFARRGQMDEARRLVARIPDPRRNTEFRTWIALKANPLSQDERLQELRSSFEDSLKGGGGGSWILWQIYALDPSAGSAVLPKLVDHVAPNQYHDYVHAITVPNDLLKVHQAGAAKGVDIFVSPWSPDLVPHRAYALLAIADSEYALKAAASVPEKQKAQVIAAIARGIARNDLDRATKLVADLPMGPRPSWDELAQQFLIANPGKFDLVADRISVQYLAQAAAALLRESKNGDAFFRLLHDVGEAKAEHVLLIMSNMIGREKARIALPAYDKIGNDNHYVLALCNLAENLRRAAAYERPSLFGRGGEGY